MKKMDRLKNKVRFDRKMVIFLIILGLIGIIAGSFFVTILNSSDIEMVKSYLDNFINNITNGNLDYFAIFKNNLFANIFTVLFIWFLGISVIGVPVLLVVYFSKTFILGFVIGSIISVYKIKGILFAIVYIFPGQIITLISIFILTMYALSFSIKLIYSVFKKKTIDFKLLINRYLLILGIFTMIILLSLSYDSFLMPSAVKLILPLLK